MASKVPEVEEGAAPRPDEPPDRQSGPTPDVGWSSAADAPRRSLLRAFAPLVVGGSLALGAWNLSGDYFADKARLQAANRWDELRVCLLGDALKPGERPGERVRFIRLANPAPAEGGESWPQRCLPYAEGLDEALAARAVVSQLGALPSAVNIVKHTDDPAVRSDLDLLFSELEMADLPLPRHGTMVVSAPGSVKPTFQREDLEPLGKVLELADVTTALDPGTGHNLRALLAEATPLSCHFNDGTAQERWRSLRCKKSPLVVNRDARVDLAPTEQGGLDLISVRDTGDTDGIYDAATGLMVLQPRYFDTQTHVDAHSNATIVYAKLQGDSSRDRVDHFRLLRSEPGKRPETRRLRIPPDARLSLLPNDVLWWVAGDAKTGDELIAQGLPQKRSKPLESKRVLGMLPHESRFMDRCADGSTSVVMFGAGLADKRYTLLFHGPSGFAPLTDVGTIEGHVTLSCHEGNATLQRIQHQRVSRWQCSLEGCKLGLSDPLSMLEAPVQAVAPVGKQVAVAWKDVAGALRLRVASPDDLAKTKDTVLIDEWQHGGVEMTALRFVSGAGLAVLLAQDIGRRIYVLRIDDKGVVEPVKFTR